VLLDFAPKLCLSDLQVCLKLLVYAALSY